MMTYILIALVTMATATLCVHLGLTEAIVEVVGKIATCSTCASFWATFLLLAIVYQTPLLWSLLLSILAAYASHWLIIILLRLQKLYDKLWQRLNQEK